MLNPTKLFLLYVLKIALLILYAVPIFTVFGDVLCTSGGSKPFLEGPIATAFGIPEMQKVIDKAKTALTPAILPFAATGALIGAAGGAAVYGYELFMENKKLQEHLKEKPPISTLIEMKEIQNQRRYRSDNLS